MKRFESNSDSIGLGSRIQPVFRLDVGLIGIEIVVGNGSVGTDSRSELVGFICIGHRIDKE